MCFLAINNLSIYLTIICLTECFPRLFLQTIEISVFIKKARKSKVSKNSICLFNPYMDNKDVYKTEYIVFMTLSNVTVNTDFIYV